MTNILPFNDHCCVEDYSYVLSIHHSNLCITTMYELFPFIIVYVTLLITSFLKIQLPLHFRNTGVIETLCTSGALKGTGNI